MGQDHNSGICPHYCMNDMTTFPSFLQGIPRFFPGSNPFDATINLLISQFESPTGPAVAAYSLFIRTIKNNGFILIPAQHSCKIVPAFSVRFRFIPPVHILVGKFKMLCPRNMLLLVP